MSIINEELDTSCINKGGTANVSLVPYREEAFFIDGKCVELTFHHV
ncbi:MAG: hypothetical protein LOD92_08605 [Bacillales bacterium]